MKQLLFACLALSILAAPTAFAQDEAPTYLSIFTAHTKLGQSAQYEAAVKELWAAMKKAGGDFPVFVSQSTSNPGDYVFVRLLSSMADLDAQNAVFNKVFGQDPNLGAALSQSSNGNSSAIIAPRPDLAYRPENPRLSEDERNFAGITALFAKPEHAQALEGVIKEFAELSAKKGIRDGFGVSQNVTGEGPVYSIRVQARSEADFYAQAEKNDQLMGEEGAALREKAGKMINRIEVSSGVFRRDLGYQP